MPQLTKKQRTFCEEYVRNGGNATKAYLFAYDCEYTTANGQGYRMLRKEGIREYIVELQKRAYEVACINAERVALKLAEIAFADKEDEYYSVSAQLKSLELLQKQLGLQKQHIEADLKTDIVINIDE